MTLAETTLPGFESPLRNGEARRLLGAAPCSASDLDATDFGWNNPDEECEPDFTLDDLEWSEKYE